MNAHDHSRAPREPSSREAAHAASRSHVRADASRGRARWVFFGFLAVSAFFLLAEHRAHLLGFLPWLILLACPLMHLFMHGGHGHGGHGGHRHAPHDRDDQGDDK